MKLQTAMRTLMEARPDLAEHLSGIKREDKRGWEDLPNGVTVQAARIAYNAGKVELVTLKVGTLSGLFAIPRTKPTRRLSSEMLPTRAA